MPLHPIASVTELPTGSARCFEIAGRRIAVFHTDSGFLAIDDECPHEGASLSEGTINGECVTCPWHSAEFDLRTGEVLTPPATDNVRSYPVVVTGDQLSVEVG
jgi:nitrite reductase/ring-hydroxylating ferredoxin subunit